MGEPEVITVERTIAASPGRIFDVLADPARHPEIDGSGTVKGAVEGPARLSPGARFGIRMRNGLPYTMRNEVVELEEGRCIAWRPRWSGPDAIAKLIGGHVFRYELEPVPGGTRVRETYDWSRNRQKPFLRLARVPQQTRRNMERTLERLEQVVTHLGS